MQNSHFVSFPTFPMGVLMYGKKNEITENTFDCNLEPDHCNTVFTIKCVCMHLEAPSRQTAPHLYIIQIHSQFFHNVITLR
jgi:hypothetical protein